MEVWKSIFLSKWVICRFHVNLPGCSRNKFSIPAAHLLITKHRPVKKGLFDTTVGMIKSDILSQRFQRRVSVQKKTIHNPYVRLLFFFCHDFYVTIRPLLIAKAFVKIPCTYHQCTCHLRFQTKRRRVRAWHGRHEQSRRRILVTWG